MIDKKFKVGDRVKIINCSSIEPYELNKIGTIVKVDIWGDEMCGNYIVDMGRPRRLHDDETCWWLRKEHIELVNKPNTQLLFEFMY